MNVMLIIKYSSSVMQGKRKLCECHTRFFFFCGEGTLRSCTKLNPSVSTYRSTLELMKPNYLRMWNSYNLGKMMWKCPKKNLYGSEFTQHSNEIKYLNGDTIHQVHITKK